MVSYCEKPEAVVVLSMLSMKNTVTRKYAALREITEFWDVTLFRNTLLPPSSGHLRNPTKLNWCLL
jgi:hypothetical protein